MSGLILFVLTSVVLTASAVVAGVAYLDDRMDILARAARVGIVWSVAYASLLIGASTTSDQIVLAKGEKKVFCGVYLDCHLSVEVLDAWASQSVVFDDVIHKANGKFIFVSMKASSSAVSDAIRFENAQIRVRDDAGNVFSRRLDLEYKLAMSLGQPYAPEPWIPRGTSSTMTLVFDVDREASNHFLDVTIGNGIDRLAETFLIGDEDSLLHQPVLLKLETRTNIQS